MSRKDREEIKLKFIDTASKFGHGRFQSSKERIQFMVSAERVVEMRGADVMVLWCLQGKLKRDIELEKKQSGD